MGACIKCGRETAKAYPYYVAEHVDTKQEVASEYAGSGITRVTRSYANTRLEHQYLCPICTTFTPQLKEHQAERTRLRKEAIFSFIGAGFIAVFVLLITVSVTAQGAWQAPVFLFLAVLVFGDVALWVSSTNNLRKYKAITIDETPPENADDVPTTLTEEEGSAAVVAYLGADPDRGTTCYFTPRRFLHGSY